MATTSNKPVKFIAVFTMLAGLLMIVAGGVTWGLVQSQLKDEHITVAPVTPENPGRLAGKDVAGPFTAYAQASAIQHHALDGAQGKTYAQIGAEATALKAKLKASGASDADIADNAVEAFRWSRGPPARTFRSGETQPWTRRCCGIRKSWASASEPWC